MDEPSNQPQRLADDSGASRGSYPGATGGNPEGRTIAGGLHREAWASLRRVGIFGGSFDPLHRGHLYVAATAQAARGLERVVFVPAAQPPHKPDQVLASGANRLAMLELGLRDHSDWIVDSEELERPGPSYTIDTVQQVRGRFGLHPDARLFLLLGSDNLRGFAKWKDVDLLLRLTEPVVVARVLDLRLTLESLRRELSPSLAARFESAIIPCKPLEVSSTEIRAALSRGRVPHEALPAGVAEYIEAHGIYEARPIEPPRTG